MMRFQGFFVLSKLYALVYGAALWQAGTTPHPEQSLTLQFYLNMPNVDQALERLQHVSTPGSGCYGQYLTHAQLEAVIAPSNESDHAIMTWLESAGLTQVRKASRVYSLISTVEEASTLLNTTFFWYEHIEGTMLLRPAAYSLPEHVSDHIELVTPTTYLPSLNSIAPVVPVPDAALSPRAVSFSCKDGPLSPTCLKQMYNITYGYTPNNTSGSRLGFTAFLSQTSRAADLKLYQEKYNLPLSNYSSININNASTDQSTAGQHGEANLDVQVLSALAHPLPITEILTGGSPPFIPNLDLPNATSNTNEPYLDYLNYIINLSDDDLPQVLSSSYGDYEQTVPADYARTVCNMIGLMSLRGVTMLESSGDVGVGASCTNNDGSDTPQFDAQFPASCPWLTAVGGTQSIPSEAWPASSGGFSRLFPQPAYQSSIIQTYLDKHIKPEEKAFYAKHANLSARAFPDLSALAGAPGYSIYLNNQLISTGGTSGACPVVASIVAMLNAARLERGMPTLGFINPWLYSQGYQSLVDIQAGSSKGCGGVSLQTGQAVANASIIPSAGFTAVEGWDPATGLGEPDFGKMLAAVTADDFGSVKAGQTAVCTMNTTEWLASLGIEV